MFHVKHLTGFLPAQAKIVPRETSFSASQAAEQGNPLTAGEYWGDKAGNISQTKEKPHMHPSV
jgi:hypothetical protein